MAKTRSNKKARTAVAKATRKPRALPRRSRSIAIARKGGTSVDHFINLFGALTNDVVVESDDIVTAAVTAGRCADRIVKFANLQLRSAVMQNGKAKKGLLSLS